MAKNELDLAGIEKWSAVIGNINKLSPNVNVTQLLEVTGTLVEEIHRLRREVNKLAKDSYDQIIDKRWSWDQEFEPPYPDEAEG